MINKVYRLIAPKQITVEFEERNLDGEGIIVRPTRLSVCAADQRYYTGSRGKEAMKKKLPMALIHEGVGEVIYDPKGEFKPGDTVVMIPNTPTQTDNIIAENYLRTSKFRASGYDGFMQQYVFMKRDRIIKYENINHDVASFLELISVSAHSIDRFDKKAHDRRDVIGVWGDGSVGFITALILKKKFPQSKIVVFGKNEEKLNFFSFVDETIQIDNIPDDLRVDHAFEAVGGKGSQYAIDQIIDYINPEGTIALLGVSENPVPINTRMVLEKGLTLVGSSRSGRVDFQEGVDFLEAHEDAQNQLQKLISAVIDVRGIEDIIRGFEHDLTTPFKTVLNWRV
ncbi:ribitol-5-phosphate dehydrogenase [Clostridium baratii]|uniref:Ribulose-5-phosphate reductase n=1 Tax=Clostridium baratii TaxID=1561 RepID=A0A174UKL5_9CLOT|nr:ribitol-5-phosphate dehydrogenase [Clostridium baratii]OPF53061.1 ribitol-5-phosphate dehydrogenase [Clostridium baratii]OPF53717.1 ribitol-5-phosphate dehydrogenase [Clostridium baratii]OPF54433.1 ribitol-5-phosphate dehydrogenase [Clostridium baratii]OPF60905.1 ribitol-5-phosphate dehydrogenase [Clostridium baratii]CUQ20265.1 zinc-dependent alcohol dehydrogenase [Clostridium baratii]